MFVIPALAALFTFVFLRPHEVFEPLKDLAVFRRFRLDTELNTIIWETGADLAPEYLYERAAAQPAASAAGPSARR